MQEAGVLTNSCTWFNFHSTVALGINASTIKDCYLRTCLNGIQLKTEGTAPNGWITGFNAVDVFIDRGVNLVNFDITPGSFGPQRNLFRNCGLQSFTALTEYGVKNIAGDTNVFDTVWVWDISGGAVGALECNVTDQATNTVIKGGGLPTLA